MSEKPATEIPTGWAWTVLGEITELKGGLTKGKKRKPTDTLRQVPFLRVANVQRGFLDLTDVQNIAATESEIAQLRLMVGDVLLNEGGDRDKLGRGWVWFGKIAECIHQNHVFRARILNGCLIPKLLSWYGNTEGQKYFFEEGKQTTNLASINLTNLKALPILVPPLSEQHRIVEALESYLSRLDDAVANLERVRRNLKRYRASVLKAAVEGRLVPTEADLARREQRDYEPASALLARILAERKRRFIEDAAAKARAKAEAAAKAAGKAWTRTDDDKTLAAERAKTAKKYQEPAAPDTTDLPTLPEGWCWAAVDHCVETQVGNAFKSKDFREEGINLLRGDNIGHGELRWDENRRKCINEEMLAQYPHLRLEIGDIILAMDRPVISTGLKIARVRDSDIPALLVQRVIRLRPAFNKDYFYLNLLSPAFIKHMRLEERGGGVPHISEGQIKDFKVPLPPEVEQKRIASEMARLLSIVDDLNTAAELNTFRCQRLRQAILKWAFEGRLVDQDPADEPASVLLERIKAERAASPSKPKAGRGRKRSKA